MALNKGYLTSSSDTEAQEMYTPFYAVDPIVKYIPEGATVWCPFDKEWSAFVQAFREHGNDVIASHITGSWGGDTPHDFFEWQPERYDVIVSNPPFAIKDDILKRLYDLGKPFAVLLPMNSLQGQKRYKCFRNGVQLLAFDQRIGFHNRENMDKPVEGSPFATGYFCRGVLPRSLIMEHIEKYDRALQKK